jgi:hypothetical protein
VQSRLTASIHRHRHPPCFLLQHDYGPERVLPSLAKVSCSLIILTQSYVSLLHNLCSASQPSAMHTDSGHLSNILSVSYSSTTYVHEFLAVNLLHAHLPSRTGGILTMFDCASKHCQCVHVLSGPIRIISHVPPSLHDGHRARSRTVVYVVTWTAKDCTIKMLVHQSHHHHWTSCYSCTQQSALECTGVGCALARAQVAFCSFSFMIHFSHSHYRACDSPREYCFRLSG